MDGTTFIKRYKDYLNLRKIEREAGLYASQLNRAVKKNDYESIRTKINDWYAGRFL